MEEQIKQLILDLGTETRKMQQETRKIQQETRKIQQTIGGYTKAEADAIEDEVNKDVKVLLPAVLPRSAIYKVSKKEWPRLVAWKKSEARNKDTREITEFDGLFVLSQDSRFDLDEVYGERIQATVATTRGPTRFVVVEAKHGITNGMINDKIAQMKRFQEYIETARAPDRVQHTLQFLADIEKFNIRSFDTNIIVIFASPNVSDVCSQYIARNQARWLAEGLEVWYMTLGGNRYELNHWNGSQFQVQRVISSSGAVIYGGNNSMTSRKSPHRRRSNYADNTKSPSRKGSKNACKRPSSSKYASRATFLHT